jgi:hypothetical protein
MPPQSNNQKSNIPIIFMHYGDAPHLQFTFRSALAFNSNKDVILLGDEHNVKYCQLGIKHYHFKDLNKTPEITRFEEVFKVIKHPRFRMDDYWIKFVTLRFFHLYEFVKQNNIKSFWTFDTDNLILTDLSAQENKFEHYDFTTQNHGKSMQGFIKNTDALEAYVRTINNLFNDPVYIKANEVKFSEAVGALTEMDLYFSFQERSNFKFIRLNEIIDNETFDDQVTGDGGMEMGPDVIKGYLPVKKIYISDSGEIFYKYLKTGSFVRINSIDMSWAPVYLFNRILKHALKKLNGHSSRMVDVTTLKVLSVKPPLSFVMRSNFWRLLGRFKLIKTSVF